MTPEREQEIRVYLSSQQMQAERGNGSAVGVCHDLLAALDSERDRTAEAGKLVSAYYAYHSEDGLEVCPCDVCEKARPYFAAILNSSGAAAVPVTEKR